MQNNTFLMVRFWSKFEAGQQAFLISGGEADNFGSRSSIEVFDGEEWRLVNQYLFLRTFHYRRYDFQKSAAIAQWIRLWLPSCCPSFKSQAHHLQFYQFIFELCHTEKTKIIKKRPGLAH